MVGAGFVQFSDYQSAVKAVTISSLFFAPLVGISMKEILFLRRSCSSNIRLALRLQQQQPLLLLQGNGLLFCRCFSGGSRSSIVPALTATLSPRLLASQQQLQMGRRLAETLQQRLLRRTNCSKNSWHTVESLHQPFCLPSWLPSRAQDFHLAATEPATAAWAAAAADVSFFSALCTSKAHATTALRPNFFSKEVSPSRTAACLSHGGYREYGSSSKKVFSSAISATAGAADRTHTRSNREGESLGKRLAYVGLGLTAGGALTVLLLLQAFPSEPPPHAISVSATSIYAAEQQQQPALQKVISWLGTVTEGVATVFRGVAASAGFNGSFFQRDAATGSTASKDRSAADVCHQQQQQQPGRSLIPGYNQMEESVLEHTDNALVLFFHDAQDAQEHQPKAQQLHQLISERQQAKLFPKSLVLFYALRTEVPEVIRSSEVQRREPVVMMFKSQRRKRVTLTDLLLLLQQHSPMLEAADTARRQEPQTHRADVTGTVLEEEISKKPNRAAAIAQSPSLSKNSAAAAAGDSTAGGLSSGEAAAVLSFYEQQSEKEDRMRMRREALKYLPQRVVGANFEKEVLSAATLDRPILLQLFEDSCFLCFLMRPFLNSVSQMLHLHKIPVSLKRINIETNDFPEGCPLARATPTFVFYSGKGTAGEKWAEFKPKDFLRKLEEKCHLPTELKISFARLLEQLHERFQKVGLLSIWLLELRKLEETVLLGNQHMLLNRASNSVIDRTGELGVASGDLLTAESKIAARTGKSATAKWGGSQTERIVQHNEYSSREDDNFDAVISSFIAQDMLRDDNMEENLDYIDKEIMSAEADCLVVGAIIGETVLQHEIEYIARDCMQSTKHFIRQEVNDAIMPPQKRVLRGSSCISSDFGGPTGRTSERGTSHVGLPQPSQNSTQSGLVSTS